MSKTVPISAIPVNHEFEYNGEKYIRTTYWRGKQYDSNTGRPTFRKFNKHTNVKWLNPYSSGMNK